jgi:hypothetical protein
MSGIAKNTLQSASCIQNVSQYTNFIVSTPKSTDEFALLAIGDVAKTDGRGALAGHVYVPLFRYVSTDLQAACVAPQSTTILCGGPLGAACPPPVPCQFDNEAFTPVGNAMALGKGSIQLVQYGQGDNSSFANCAAQSIGSIVANEVPTIDTSKAARHSKFSFATAALLAASLLFSAA